jgi:hypothetical protein
MGRPPTYTDKFVCEQCGKAFEVKHWRVVDAIRKGSTIKYCCHKCSTDAYKGKQRDPSISIKGVATRRAKGSYTNPIPTTCEQCGKEFLTTEFRKSDGRGHFCSKACMSEYYRIHYRGPNCVTGLWKGGSSFGKYCYKFNNVLKDKVSARFGDECILCHLPKLQHLYRGRQSRLCIHHVYTEKMACCESKVTEMDLIRRRFPKEIAAFGEPEFTEIEIKYLRMMVPLCRSCHGKMIIEESKELPYEQTFYRKFFTELILTKYDGLSYI